VSGGAPLPDDEVAVAMSVAVAIPVAAGDEESGHPEFAELALHRSLSA
jgi:hypothetical protein